MAVDIEPKDAHNAELLRLTHPASWENPTPTGRYNLVVVGGGTAGLVAAIGAAGLGGRVALVERALMGGDCLNWGCVPSKAILRAARAAHEVRESAAFGVRIEGTISVDFGAVMDRMRQLRTQIAHHDSFARVKSTGVDTFLGEARFTAPDALTVGGTELRFAKAVIATGGRARVPPIPGLADLGALTNETIFQLTTLPRHLLVVGAGPIGAELAQAFRRFGSQVTLIDQADRILTKDDPDASAVVAAQLQAEGVSLLLSATLDHFAQEGDEKVAYLRLANEPALRRVAGDAVLLALGRQPNIERLHLDAANVAFDPRGVTVDEHLRSTSNPNIYASGDVAGHWQLTHAADVMSRFVIQNALFFGRKKLSDVVMPWCTYTDPEVAHVGISAEAAASRDDVDTYTIPMSKVDRAILEGDTRGFVRVHADRSGHILGGTVVARHAGDLIGELTVAMTHRVSLGQLAGTIHPYPTEAEAFKKAGDAWNRTRLTPAAASVLNAILRFRR